MYDDVATLISYGTSTFDEYGNESIETEKTDVFVMPRGVYQSEYYNAAQVGLKPSITFELTNREDYNDQKVVEYHERFYTVIRVDWNAQRDKISLICEERTNNG
jgi:SPP1 family predicted phage head-tail adaptor